MPKSVFTGECEVEGFHPTQIAVAHDYLLTVDQARVVAADFQALSHPARIQLLCALHATELCVCDLAQVLGLSVSTVSHHLKVLRQVRLVTFRTEGRMAYYSLVDSPTLRYFLDAVTPCTHAVAETHV